MDYCLFLETNLDYGVSLNYDRYGIYGDFIQTTREGEELYFKLNEKIIGPSVHIPRYPPASAVQKVHFHSIQSRPSVPMPVPENIFYLYNLRALTWLYIVWK